MLLTFYYCGCAVLYSFALRDVLFQQRASKVKRLTDVGSDRLDSIEHINIADVAWSSKHNNERTWACLSLPCVLLCRHFAQKIDTMETAHFIHVPAWAALWNSTSQAEWPTVANMLKYKQGCQTKDRPISTKDGRLSVWHVDQMI